MGSVIKQISFRYLPWCGQPGSVNRPRNSITTQVSSDCYPPPPSLPSNLPSRFSIDDNASFSVSSSSAAFDDDLSSQGRILGLLEPRSKLRIVLSMSAPSVKLDKQASLAKTLATRGMDVCYVCETRIQEPSAVIHLTSPGQSAESAKLTLRVSGDSIASSRSLAGVGIALSTRAGNSLLDWIPLSLCNLCLRTH
ncbi:unnamed protein product [Heterobilharzia americana]|nr:unnamed protein product [Heterobilharzia americana]